MSSKTRLDGYHQNHVHERDKGNHLLHWHPWLDANTNLGWVEGGERGGKRERGEKGERGNGRERQGERKGKREGKGKGEGEARGEEGSRKKREEKGGEER